MGNTGKVLAIIGGLVVILSIGLAYVADFFAFYKSEVSNVLGNLSSTIQPLDRITNTGDILGITGTEVVNNTTLMILFIIILAGGVVGFVGGLAGNKGIAVAGGLVAILGVVLFAVFLPSIYEDTGVDLSTIPDDMSLLFTFGEERGLITTTYTFALWVGFYLALAGGALATVGGLAIKD